MFIFNVYTRYVGGMAYTWIVGLTKDLLYVILMVGRHHTPPSSLIHKLINTQAH